jgi:ABC-type antimicrobial peptide transport system permease subunit
MPSRAGAGVGRRSEYEDAASPKPLTTVSSAGLRWSIYSVLSYAVSARKTELGIRIALGGSRPRVLRLILAQGAVLTCVGVTLGTAGALALTRVLRAMLFEVTPTDPATFVVAAVGLASVAMFACLNPARRAMAVDPIAALRRG